MVKFPFDLCLINLQVIENVNVLFNIDESFNMEYF